MQKLIEFLVGKRHWLLLILCEIISFTLLYRYNAYQRNVLLSSANMVSGSILSVSNAVFSFVNLGEENKNLNKQNEQMELEILNLKLQLAAINNSMLSYDQLLTDSLPRTYEYISAEVRNNSVTHLMNYITIDKGYKDGIRQEMGVVSTHGVVGKVHTVGDHFAVVISLLNPAWKLSCKLINGNDYGSLAWDGRSAQYAYLEELPTYTEYRTGDKVVTTGFTGVFPPGLVVGTVEKPDNTSNTGLYALKVKLAADFRRLSTVRVIKNNLQNEQWSVEREAKKND